MILQDNFMAQNSNKNLFQKMNIQKAVLTLVIPTVLSQLIVVIYNMSDSFWIGQLNDPAQIAAATLCVPAFLLTMGIANIFGIGGASLISRCLGQHRYTQAKATCAFCLWSAIICALIYGILFSFFEYPLLHFIGATSETYSFSTEYAFWTVVLGSVPATLNGLFGHLVRSEGYAKQASFGMALGVILNMILDPILIFAFHLQIAGAALATLLSMTIGCIYFIHFICTRPQTSVLTLNPKHYRIHNIAAEVLLVGLPSTLTSLMALSSNVVINILTASYSTFAVAGMGIAKRIDLIVFAIANGFGQGVLPLIGYTYAAKNFQRMRAAIKITLLYSLGLAIVTAIGLYFSAHPLIQLFIQDEQTVLYGQAFLKIICVTCPCVSLTLIMLTIFQATGQKFRPIFLSLIRKGGLDIPLMYFLNHSFGVLGIAWALPIEDIIAMVIAFIMFVPFWKNLSCTTTA